MATKITLALALVILALAAVPILAGPRAPVQASFSSGGSMGSGGGNLVPIW